MQDFDFKARHEKLKNFIENNDLDCLILTNLQNIYYFTGTGQYCVLVFAKDDEPVLFVRRNFFKAKSETIIKNVIELKKTSQIKKYLMGSGSELKKLRIGMELDSLPASYYLYYKQLLKHADIVNIELELRKIRMIKEKAELDLLKRAGIIAQKAQEVIPRILTPGIKEHEIAAEVMRESIRNESMHFSNVNAMLKNWFIVASGENLWIPSAFPVLSGNGFSEAVPYCYSDRVIKKGDIVMCDYAVMYQGYHADHARTYYVESYSEKFKERYLLLKNAYLETVDQFLSAGTSVNKIYENMYEILKKSKLEKYFQGDGHYYQGLGHGIGLELDEPPFVVRNDDMVLEENMVIALEPKIIIPNWGAIDLEDNYIITKDKPKRITNTEYLF